MKKQFFVILLIIFPLFWDMVSVAAAAPPIIEGSIGPERPYIDTNVVVLVSYEITDPLGNPYTTTGLTATIFWSRDGINYNSVAMSAVGSLQYQGSIPSQDGEEYAEYNDGSGQLYVYVVLENNQGEQSFWFTPSNPNTDVYYIETAGQQPTQEPSKIVIEEQPYRSPIIDLIPEEYLSEDFLMFASIILVVVAFFFMPNAIDIAADVLVAFYAYLRRLAGGKGGIY